MFTGERVREHGGAYYGHTHEHNEDVKAQMLSDEKLRTRTCNAHNAEV